MGLGQGPRAPPLSVCCVVFREIVEGDLFKCFQSALSKPLPPMGKAVLDLLKGLISVGKIKT